MKIKKHIVGMLQANCYLVWDEDSKQALLIDPGGAAKKLARTVSDKGLELKAIVHTHGHWDHTSAGRALQRITKAPVYRHPADNRSGFLYRTQKTDDKKIFDIEGGRTLEIGPLSFETIHTPGHSLGSICLVCQNALFTGDLLFQGSVGRTDMKGGSFRALVKSLNEGLAHLPDDMDVFPGHGPATTLGQERRTNPFFKLARDIKSGKATLD